MGQTDKPPSNLPEDSTVDEGAATLDRIERGLKKRAGWWAITWCGRRSATERRNGLLSFYLTRGTSTNPWRSNGLSARGARIRNGAMPSAHG